MGGDTLIYYIKDTRSGLIKIGYTKQNPTHRLSHLQIGNPFLLELLGYEEGDEKMEYEIQTKYIKQHCGIGEWFTPCLKLLLHIKNNTTTAKSKRKRKHFQMSKYTNQELSDSDLGI